MLCRAINYGSMGNFGQLKPPRKNKDPGMQEARQIKATKALPSRMTAQQFQALIAGRDPGFTTEQRATQAQAVKPLPVAAPAEEVRPPRRSVNSPEEDLQIACFQWVSMLELKYPILKWMVHVPNGGKRTKAQAGRLKAMGVKSGVVDVLLPRKFNGRPGLAIELKSDKGRLTEKQAEWLQALSEDGYVTGVARTMEEFQSLVWTYLGKSPGG